MNRLHFVGRLPYNDYLNLLQVSSAHIYLTYPFILSWSMLESMATGCVIIASNTAPVKEYMQDNYNGLLVDFNDVNAIAEKVSDVINNREKYTEISQNARKTIIEQCELQDMLKRQINIINSLVEG